MKTRSIYCCGCEVSVAARLTDGKEIYPHRSDLEDLPFWKCDACGNFVGCHHKTKDRTRPKGNIATPELRDARKKIHAILDPMWESGTISRRELYAKISEKVGYPYHTGDIATIEHAREVYKIIRDIGGDLK